MIRLYITSLPVVVVDYSGGDLYENRVPGTMTIYDPDETDFGGHLLPAVYDITIGYRGQSSRNYKKHNYTIHLWENGEQYKTSILGMRRDDDWILYGHMNDQIRLRNTVAMKVWDEFYTLPWSRDSGAISGVFCELIIRGKYNGLYRMSERLDRKQAQIDKENGQIVRSVQASSSGVNLVNFSNVNLRPPHDSELWYNMEIKYPKAENVTAADWERFADLLHFAATSGDEEFAAHIGEYIDIDNFASYYVYIIAIGSSGNMTKNLYFVMNDKQADPRYLLLPWDVDGSFARSNDANKAEVGMLSSNRLFERLVKTNAGGFCDLCREKWNTAKQTVLSSEHFIYLFTQYYDWLDESAVWQREANAWPEFKTFTFQPERELKYISEYMTQRFAFVDAFFNGESLSVGKWVNK